MIALVKKGYTYCISSVAEYEISTGASLVQSDFWDDFLKRTEVLSFDKSVARVAVDINNDLKRRSKQISVTDLFIAATAISNNLFFATLNRKHFERIEGLNIVE